MIARLRGDVAEVTPDRLVLDVNGVGYEVWAPSRLLDTARREPRLTVHVYTSVREDAITLYGFETQQEKAAFEALLSVSQVGPKLALATLSALTPEQLSVALNTNDLHSLTRISGVGKKTAERMVLELKGKLAFSPTVVLVAQDDLLPSALGQLGYKLSEIEKVLVTLKEKGLNEAPLQERLRESLKIFSGDKR